MRESRVYLEQSLQCDQTLALPQDCSNHISRVLRMRCGQRIRLFNGTGGSYLAEIVVISKRQVDVKVLAFCDEERESRLRITLVQGVARSQHMDTILQKAVELGVSTIVPVITEFSKVQIDQQRKDKKMLHWQRIIIAACEQCGRNILPKVAVPMALAQWLALEDNTKKLLLHPQAGQRLASMQLFDTSLVLLSGPEGGFSPAEVKQAINAGYVSVELGPRVLRTETAAVAAISACQTLWGDMG